MSVESQPASRAFLDHPTKLFVEVTTRCNMQCAMCVKQAPGGEVKEGDLALATFDRLAPALPRTETLILNGIGEPLLHPGLEGIIHKAKGLMPGSGWIGFQTNGLWLDAERASRLAAAGLDRVCLSLDAVTPEAFRKIRMGGEVEDLARAFAALAEAQRHHPRAGLRTGVEFVLMRENLHQLPEVLRWSASRGASFAIVTNVLPYHEALVPEMAYDTNTDAALDLFRAWQSKAKDAGLDLRDHSRAMWKQGRTPEDLALVDVVRAMHADARAKDVFLHLDNLLRRDESLESRVAEVFEEARSIAETTGMELRLPRPSPANDRICPFVDDGSAFIAWDGDVHPCYFLWHRFQCHFPDHKKFVEPKAFGNLSEKGILDIWNSPGFLEFRREAMAQDFPVCSNCKLHPCEYVYTERFEQDCFASKVPCGDCFWCMGLFSCLS